MHSILMKMELLPGQITAETKPFVDPAQCPAFGEVLRQEAIDVVGRHIAQTLHSAVAGLSVLDPRVQATLLAAVSTPEARAATELPDSLTQREAEILRLIARGMTNAEIAASLFLSANTVKTHINRVFAKTGSRDRVAAIRYARDHGLD